jgi:asparagine synthase (glutamine-hydrolysing)
MILRRMTDTIVHRGPDADGFWLDSDAGIALGHRRLSILDLSPEGNQPMVSSGGRFVVVFNGEIYNYRDIRAELDERQHRPWRGHSDTEVMLAAMEEWGIEGALKRFVGMFAFALWDGQERRLTVARDRLGEKPMYYGWCNGTFLFASELKALRVHPAFNGDIDRNSLTLFLRHNYIPAPYSIYRDIRKLLPGTYLTVQADRRDDAPTAYWSAFAAAEAGRDHPFVGSDREAVDQLELLLRRSVRQQMVADVPLGAFLSGGIDSSTIVALMQDQSSTPIRTFTIGFHEERYSEAEHARAVARHLGTDHTELFVTPQQALDVIPRLPHLYDEPFSDSSQIPTFLVSEMTRKHVTVSLSGDAGDELFGGYGRYLECNRLWRMTGWLPVAFRRNAARLLAVIPFSLLDTGLVWLSPVWERYGRPGRPSAKIQALLELLLAANSARFYQRTVSTWKVPASIVIGGVEPFTALTDESRHYKGGSYLDRMMYLDILSYLPDDILVKVDRAAMGVSLETRVPMLDHRVVEYALSLPASLKFRQGVTKWPLRQVLHRYVPHELVKRPKMGFAVPICSWLRGALREWADALLNEDRLRREGFFRPEPILQKWREHLAGTADWQQYLWDVLMFQAWLQAQ